MYRSQCDEGCRYCKYKQYDTHFDESWCGHKPLPEMIGPQLLVDDDGICEYYERGEWYDK